MCDPRDFSCLLNTIKWVGQKGVFMRIRIGTRKSKLAILQTKLVIDQIKADSAKFHEALK